MMQVMSDPSFTEPGFDAKVAYGKFPEGLMISDQGENFGTGISVDVAEAQQKAGVEWLRFMATDQEMIRREGRLNGQFSPMVPLTQADMAEFNPPMKTYSELVPTVKKTIPSFQGKWDPLTQHEVIETQMINLINGTLTPQAIADMMTAAAKRYAAENQ
jgi:hypothetical protein